MNWTAQLECPLVGREPGLRRLCEVAVGRGGGLCLDEPEKPHGTQEVLLRGKWSPQLCLGQSEGEVGSRKANQALLPAREQISAPV